MKGKQITSLLVGISLVLVLVLSACGQAAPTTPTTPTAPSAPTTPTTPSAPQVVKEQVDKVYKVLNPQGVYIPVDCKPLAPRLTTFDGKTIFYYKSEANAVIMQVLIKWLERDYPKTTFTMQGLETGSFGLSTPGKELEGMHAVIRGVSW